MGLRGRSYGYINKEYSLNKLIKTISKLKVLVTGSAGFIGFHLTRKLLNDGYEVIGLDNINDYYDKKLKYARLFELGIDKNKIRDNKFVTSSIYVQHRFIKICLEDKKAIHKLFETEKFDFVINMAAQAGVRSSIDNPDIYIKSNIIGFFNLLEACRMNPVKHFVFASSSSVYGDSSDVPFNEKGVVDSPVSLYAATKKSGELMAYSYSHLYNIPVSGLRFFTVYGPWGRPDMAIFLFTERIINEEPIIVFNNGNLSRDFTYIDDIVSGIGQILQKVPEKKGMPPYRILNIGNSTPVKLMNFIERIETAVGKKAIVDFQPMQMGDVHDTWADLTTLNELTGYEPKTSVEEGVAFFVDWFKSYTNSKI